MSPVQSSSGDTWSGQWLAPFTWVLMVDELFVFVRACLMLWVFLWSFPTRPSRWVLMAMRWGFVCVCVCGGYGVWLPVFLVPFDTAELYVWCLITCVFSAFWHRRAVRCVSESLAVSVWQHPAGDLRREGVRQNPGHKLSGRRASGAGWARQRTGKEGWSPDAHPGHEPASITTSPHTFCHLLSYQSLTGSVNLPIFEHW